MLFELALLSVAVSATVWGVTMVRRRAPAGIAFALCATAVLAWVAYAGRRNEGPPIFDLLGAIAIGAGACLLVIGPAVREAARWAIAHDRLQLAGALLEVHAVLQPGMGGRDDQATLRALRAVRRGEVDDVVAALRGARQEAPPVARRMFDERIALLYVVAMRWPEAIAHAEATLAAHSPAYRAILDDPLAAIARAQAHDPAAPVPTTPGDVAHALGMSPPVWIELCAAYGRVGRLDHAAALAAVFERV
ncbi:MAG: hypothetical protein K8W52_16865, partial [Deltaproteobacteria bacterium]|nr:hypothetical protein [Deltaproteobacteria bacterium]